MSASVRSEKRLLVSEGERCMVSQKPWLCHGLYIYRERERERKREREKERGERDGIEIRTLGNPLECDREYISSGLRGSKLKGGIIP